jgi:hypothetical protein
VISLLSRLPRPLLIAAAVLAIVVGVLVAFGLYRTAAGALGALGLMLFGAAKPRAVPVQVDAVNQAAVQARTEAEAIAARTEVAAGAATVPAKAVDGAELLDSLGGRR